MTSDTHEPTAWEEINPTMGLVPRQERQSLCSARLEPASNDHFRNELTACLALVAPAGMSEENRRDWLAVAWGTLSHLPADLLSMGCAEARKTCDHPAKIVPTIIAATEEKMSLRRDWDYDARHSAIQAPRKPRPLLDRRGEKMTEAECEELNGILEKLGAVARYRADGSRYVVAQADTRPKGGDGTEIAAPFTSGPVGEADAPTT